MSKKVLLILLDGLGDRSYDQFQGQTPLQAAHTPVLDQLAAAGANGTFHAAQTGQALPSENAHFSLFGYDQEGFPGRGALEALGAGIALAPGDVAVLTHFASVYAKDARLYLKNGKPRVAAKEAGRFFEAASRHIQPSTPLALIRTHGLHGIIKLQSDASPCFTDTDPFIDGQMLSELLPWESHADDPSTCRTVDVLKRFLIDLYQHLNTHPLNQERIKAGEVPINGLVTQRAGQLKPILPFLEKWGLKGIILASGLVYAGLARFLGLDFQNVPDSEDPGVDLAQRLEIAARQLKKYDFVHLHTKAPDAAAHTKNPEAKKAVVEFLDRGLGSKIQQFLDDPDILIVVTADHSTPSAGPLIHSGETVPVVFIGRGIRQDDIRTFDEVSVTKGALGHLRGPEIMYLILNHLNRSKLHGLMDTPRNQPFWPGPYEGFKLYQAP